ncbi:MAG: serine/threonine protein kinase [Acidobacteriota bacterium]|nr:serine/threonine protein kinase [Acidobacteriota bacterium]
MIEVGTILQNRYRIEKQIGQGGMGQVYVATDERFKSTVAIKETIFQDLTLRKAFEREARLLNSLKHIALPRVSDHFNENDGQFLVMEYIAGEDLAEMMEHNGAAFPFEDVLNWAYQLCDALDFLHSQQIIHRDIKPQNLKLTPNGHIVLLDFGLAKGNPTDAPHQTAAKSIFGYSRSYASLEQIQGTGTEPRSDLYSLSATLYHLLTGLPPADALTRAMNVLNGQTDPLIAANLINKKIPRGVAEILQKTMALNAGERPESAVSMRKMLEDCDKFVDANALNSFMNNPLSADLLTQKTIIMGAATNIPGSNQSQIKTVISSDEITNKQSPETLHNGADSDSVLTRVQTAAESAKNPKRARAFGAVVFGVLLLVGSAISAIYFFNPDASPTNTNAGTTLVETNSNAEIPAQQIAESAEAILANQNLLLSEKSPDIKQPDKQTITKPTETTKNNLPTKNQTQKTQQDGKTKTDVQSDEIVVNDEKIGTKDMIIDEDGIRMKNPIRGSQVSPVQQPPLPPEVFRHLSPTQIRRLERLRNRKNRMVIKQFPSPEPTP